MRCREEHIYTMNRQKILYIITKSVWGGAQRYVYDLATNMPKEKFDIVVAAGGDGILFEKLRAAGIKAMPIRSLNRDVHFTKDLRTCAELLRILFSERPDIIHLNSSKIGALGSLVAFFYKCALLNFSPRVIFTVHGWAFHEDRSSLARALIRAVSRYASYFQNGIILISSVDMVSAKQFLSHKKLFFIPHGITPPNFHPREECERIIFRATNRDIPQDEILVGTIAELTRNKGLVYLIRAAYRIRRQIPDTNIKFIIVGGGEEETILRKKIEKLNLADMVSLAGFIPDAGRLLPRFDIFVLPSVKEGLPYTIMDAFAAGVPVVATAVGGIPDLIDHKKTGILVKKKNHKHLAAGIKYLARSSERRAQIAACAQQTLAEQFPIERMIGATIQCYDQKREYA